MLSITSSSQSKELIQCKVQCHHRHPFTILFQHNIKTKMIWVKRISSLLLVWGCVMGTSGQISTHPVVSTKPGSSAVLTCQSDGVPLRLCLWEQKESDKLIATFDSSNYRDPSSSDQGYSFHGDDLQNGQCGLRIHSVQPSDLQRWKCTLLARDNATAVYRGSVLLEASENRPEQLQAMTTMSPGTHASSRRLNASPRPIVTADASLTPVKAHELHDTPVGIPVQEVEVQSGGLIIMAKRKDRKLVLL